MMEQSKKRPISDECERIEEDTLHSAKSHFNAEARWHCIHLVITVGTALTASLTFVVIMKNIADWPVYLAAITAILSAINASLNPEKRSATHGTAGRHYKSLCNQTRIYRTITLKEKEDEISLEEFNSLAARRDEINETSPAIPNWAYKKTLEAIKNGEANYKVDGSNA